MLEFFSQQCLFALKPTLYNQPPRLVLFRMSLQIGRGYIMRSPVSDETVKGRLP
jgi:hypothetical protein